MRDRGVVVFFLTTRQVRALFLHVRGRIGKITRSAENFRGVPHVPRSPALDLVGRDFVDSAGMPEGN